MYCARQQQRYGKMWGCDCGNCTVMVRYGAVTVVTAVMVRYGAVTVLTAVMVRYGAVIVVTALLW